MARLTIWLSIIAPLSLGGCYLGRALQVASAFTAHQICAQAFVIRQPTEPLFRAYVRPMIGVPIVRDLMHYSIDPKLARVRASVAGAFPSEAIYAHGRGCTVVHGAAAPRSIHRVIAQAPEGRDLPVGLDERLQALVERAFTADRRAMIIVREGRIVAERYAPGYTSTTPMQSWSMAKSVTNALIGILVQRGVLSVEGQAPGLPQGITIDHLLRQTSGQSFGSSNSGFDQASRMQFLEGDTAAYAMKGFAWQPGERWSYTDANYALLSKIIRDRVGGSPEAVTRFADRELFQPNGMTSALLEFDEAGTPMGADWAYASARDWARFGWFLAIDGIVDGVRVLPAGWTTYSAAPTPSSPLGYGAGFWTNRGPSPGARRRRSWGAPEDSFFALGNSGQVVLIAPAERLVVVSLGYSLDHSNQQPVEVVSKLISASADPDRTHP